MGYFFKVSITQEIKSGFPAAMIFFSTSPIRLRWRGERRWAQEPDGHHHCRRQQHLLHHLRGQSGKQRQLDRIHSRAGNRSS